VTEDSGHRSPREVPRSWLDAVTEIPDVGDASYDDLARAVSEHPEIPDNRPLSRAAVDPRTGERVVFCTARARRPHDHDRPTSPADPRECIVCSGKTTSVLDRASLTGGDETFINMNLFPIVYPGDGEPFPSGAETVGLEGERAGGIHFLQWSSTRHDRDVHNMPPEDVAILLERLARLEKVCLHDSAGLMPEVSHGHHGYFSVIKNVGRMVGGSLLHGHQQMIHTSMRPRRVEENAGFLVRHGEPFARHLMRENPADLTVMSYPGGARLVVPWFMKRPLDMILALDGPSDRENLHDLDAGERLSLARGLVDMTRAVTRLMPRLGREVAYNVVVHTGPVGALYVEILPYMQERGGYESAGIIICQGEPHDTAEMIRGVLVTDSDPGSPCDGRPAAP
jgi:UDPglucose--hexose-1-phosphate uridylyltransferase